MAVGLPHTLNSRGYANHFMLLQSKAVVVSNEEKVPYERDQAGEEELNVIKPPHQK